MAIESLCMRMAHWKVLKFTQRDHRDLHVQVLREPVPHPTAAMEPEEDDNEAVCGGCQLGGELICCDACPAAFHVRCTGYGEA